ncbi:hypothetical protein D3Y57_16185 [Sphingomonas paeninsulae]|jgi:hypothetical protein|uniref:Uncharacterized protein n=1 Tax=Sphingomonas paeninsulae TaxID=2319844 RepID=A0A494TCK5_SPHPE|nr:hypothetical protein [Sphingomonas paeninsulae]AYJ87187.1 hypothetical protein D3Y57_16185 [Sphingomonas paeninsulae]
MRAILLIVGILALLAGALFALQGSGVVHWPSDSSMLDQSVWQSRGITIAIAGAAIILISRRVGRR